MAHFQGAHYFFRLDPVERAADGAAALRAVRRAAENARLDAAFKVRRIVGGHFREQAIVGIGGRTKQRFSHAFSKKKLREFLVHQGQFARQGFAVSRQEHFGALFADLRCIDADPHAIHFGARAPESDVFIEVARALHHRARDHPVDIDFAAFDILENFFVGGGRAADVVVLGQPVNRDGHADARQLHPLRRDGNDGAGDDECENIHAAQDGKDAAEFFVADERFAADKRDVNRLMLANEIHHAVDERVAAEIVELAERGFAAEVRIAVGITARAGERTFTSDFDREHGDFSSENISPRGENFALGDTGIGSDGGGCHRGAIMTQNRGEGFFVSERGGKVARRLGDRKK